jgi:hypothetical protein
VSDGWKIGADIGPGRMVALAEGFSLGDDRRGALLAQGPGMPDAAATLDPATGRLPNVCSPVPAVGGWEEGPLRYFKMKPPTGVKAVGTLVGNETSVGSIWVRA